MYFGYRTDEADVVRDPGPVRRGRRHVPGHRQQLRAVARRRRGERAGHRPLAAVPAGMAGQDGGRDEGRRPHHRARRPGSAALAGPGRRARSARTPQTSLRNLGVDRLDLFYAHIDDRATPLEETVGALGELAESARSACWARATPPPGASSAPGPSPAPAGRPGYACVQQEGTYLRPTPQPRPAGPVTEELLDYAAATEDGRAGLLAAARRPLRPARPAASGRPTPTPAARPGWPCCARWPASLAPHPARWSWPGCCARTRRSSRSPAPGSVAQLDEILGATELKLDEATRQRLDQAGRGGAPS